MIIFRYTIRKGKHQHSQVVWNFFKSLFSPVSSKVKRTWLRIDLDPAYKKDITPSQEDKQHNKVFGYALLMMPNWYSIQLTVKSYDGYIEWYLFECYRGKQKETRLFKKFEDLNLFMIDLQQFRYRIPRKYRWFPMFRIHSSFGGELPAPIKLKNKITEL